MIFTLILLSDQVCFAEDSEPKEFYQHDYAKSTYDENNADARSIEEKKESEKIERRGNKDASDTGFKSVEEEKRPEPEIKEDLSYLDNPGVPVLSIGLLVNSDDKKHLIETIDELLQLAVKYDWTLSEIYLTGAKHDVMQSAEFKSRIPAITFRLGELKFVTKLPEKYKAVTKSPAWLVQTEKGQVVLEAVGTLRRYFNKQGGLINE